MISSDELRKSISEREIIMSEKQWLEAFNSKVGYWLADKFEQRVMSFKVIEESYPVYHTIRVPYMHSDDYGKYLNEFLNYAFIETGRSFERYILTRKRPFCLKSVKLIYLRDMYSISIALKPEFMDLEK